MLADRYFSLPGLQRSPGYLRVSMYFCELNVSARCHIHNCQAIAPYAVGITEWGCFHENWNACARHVAMIIKRSCEQELEPALKRRRIFGLANLSANISTPYARSGKVACLCVVCEKITANHITWAYGLEAKSANAPVTCALCTAQVLSAKLAHRITIMWYLFCEHQTPQDVIGVIYSLLSAVCRWPRLS